MNQEANKQLKRPSREVTKDIRDHSRRVKGRILAYISFGLVAFHPWPFKHPHLPRRIFVTNTQ